VFQKFQTGREATNRHAGLASSLKPEATTMASGEDGRSECSPCAAVASLAGLLVPLVPFPPDSGVALLLLHLTYHAGAEAAPGLCRTWPLPMADVQGFPL